MKGKVRWGVIGATGIAKRNTIPNGIVPAKNSTLVAVQGRTFEHVKEVGQTYNVPYFTSVEEMLGKVECDAVYIGSPQHVHLEQVRAAAGFGRHILCEKPIARNAAEAKEMVEAAGRAGVLFGTAFMLRFHSLHRKARSLVREGAIGQMVSARCQFGIDHAPKEGAFRQILEEGGGGAFIDLGNHAMDIIEFVTGRRIATVMGVSQNVIYHYETEDACAALLEFDGGGFAMVDTYFCAGRGSVRNELEIIGYEGSIVTEGTIGQSPSGTLTLKSKGKVETFESHGLDMYLGEVEAFADAILSGKEFSVGPEDGLHSQELVEACYESAKSGRRISLRKVAPPVD